VAHHVSWSNCSIDERSFIDSSELVACQQTSSTLTPDVRRTAPQSAEWEPHRKMERRMARPPQFMSTFFKQGGDFLAELL
jgi:hypothetical protein